LGSGEVGYDTDAGGFAVEVLPATRNDATNKADRDSLKLPEEDLGSRPYIGTSGGG